MAFDFYDITPPSFPIRAPAPPPGGFPRPLKNVAIFQEPPPATRSRTGRRATPLRVQRPGDSPTGLTVDRMAFNDKLPGELPNRVVTPRKPNW